MMGKRIFVCGFGRCGSSLVMQMLDAGGYPVVGQFPAYEPEYLSVTKRTAKDVIRRTSGKAAKILDPHGTPWPHDLDASIIFLHRDPWEQAKSQVKLLWMLAGMKLPDGAVEKFANSYGDSLRQSRQSFGDIPWLDVQFESLIQSPLKTAELIAGFVGGELFPKRMSACVLPRQPAARPGMDIELSLVENGKGWP